MLFVSSLKLMGDIFLNQEDILFQNVLTTSHSENKLIILCSLFLQKVQYESLVIFSFVK